MHCLFCRIAAKELPATIRYEDDTFIAIDDIHPKAPTHILIMPKNHVLASLADAGEQHRDLLGLLLQQVAHVARVVGVDEKGYKVVINTREHGGQTVDHLHVHVLGGEPVKMLV